MYAPSPNGGFSNATAPLVRQQATRTNSQHPPQTEATIRVFPWRSSGVVDVSSR